MEMTEFVSGYSRENAEQFGWSSVSGELHPERVALLKKYLVGERVLDAGCGGGAYTDYVTRNGFQAVGTDYHTAYLDIAKERGYQGRFLQADITSLPFLDKEFDTTFCFDVLEHVGRCDSHHRTCPRNQTACYHRRAA